MVAACTDDSSPGPIAPDAGPVVVTGGFCPCTIPDGDVQVSISCGGARCISEKGYRCEVDGPHEDDSLCADGGS